MTNNPVVLSVTRARALAFAFIVMYAAAWAATGVFGPGDVQDLVRGRNQPVCSEHFAHDRSVFEPQDVCQSDAVAPFLVRMNYAYVNGLAGSGGTNIFLWLPGYTLRLWSLNHWIA
jgi:hypothetical protein